MWYEVTGLDVVGPLIAPDNEHNELHRRLQKFIPGPTSQEYDELHKALQSILDVIPMKSPEGSTTDESDNEKDENGLVEADTVSTIAQTDEGHQQPVEIGLEISNASIIDKLAETLTAMERTLTLLAQKTVPIGVAVKRERIKKEPQPENYETIDVDSGTSNDERSTVSNARKRKHSSTKGVVAETDATAAASQKAASATKAVATETATTEIVDLPRDKRVKRFIHEPPRNRDKWEASDESDATKSSHKPPYHRDLLHSDMSDPEDDQDPNHFGGR
jgi:hypothetical protein